MGGRGVLVLDEKFRRIAERCPAVAEILELHSVELEALRLEVKDLRQLASAGRLEAQLQ